MRQGRHGVNTTILAVVVIVVIVGASLAYYSVRGLGPAPSTTTNSSTTTSTQGGCPSASGAYNPLNLSSMYSSYSEVDSRYNGTVNGNYVNVATDYIVAATNSTMYRINVVASSGSSINNYVDYVLKNGTAAMVTYSGSNFTGGNAEGLYLASVSNIYIGNVFGKLGLLGVLISGGFVHGSPTVAENIGSTSVLTTTYSANTLPLVENQCGTSANLGSFTMTTGTVPGEPAGLVVHMAMAGSLTLGGNPQNLSVTLTTTKVTKA